MLIAKMSLHNDMCLVCCELTRIIGPFFLKIEIMPICNKHILTLFLNICLMRQPMPFQPDSATAHIINYSIGFQMYSLLTTCWIINVIKNRMITAQQILNSFFPDVSYVKSHTRISNTNLSGTIPSQWYVTHILTPSVPR